MSEELKTLIEQQGSAFEEFKKANDARLDAIEKGQGHAELDAKVDKIGSELDKLGAVIDDIQKKANRAAAPSAEDEAKAFHAEHKAAFDKWMRKGDDTGLEALRERKNATFINVGTPSEGGYAVPIDQDRDIMRLVQDMSPMRQVCRVISCSTEDYRKMVNLGGADYGWVGETDARPATSTPTFTTLQPTFGEVYAYPETTQKALDDLFFDVQAELTYDVAEAFAKAEAVAFMSGTAVAKQPVGLLTATMTTQADGVRDFGKFQYIASGKADGFAATTPADKLLDLIYATRSHHRQNGKFMLATSTLAEIRKFKDSYNNYIWQPSMQAGQPATIFGYGFVVNEYMPALGANAIAVAFGDFKAAYWIFDRVGIRTLRDPYTHKPFVGFYTTKRVGSMIANTEALKFLKCEA